jgi:hypothetical protein
MPPRCNRSHPTSGIDCDESLIWLGHSQLIVECCAALIVPLAGAISYCMPRRPLCFWPARLVVDAMLSCGCSADLPIQSIRSIRSIPSISGYHTCIGTIIAVSRSISIQSLFYLLRRLFHCASNHCSALPLTPRHTHLFSQSNHPSGINPYHLDWHIIIAIPSYTPSPHTLPSIQYTFKQLLSSSRLISSSAPITRYVVPGRH